MTAAVCVALLCAAFLIAQRSYQAHQRDMLAEGTLLYKVEARVSALERKDQGAFDPVAFEDLKSKVDAMRIAQGIRGSR